MAAALGATTFDSSLAVGDYTYLSSSDTLATVDARYAAFLKTAAPITTRPVAWAVGNHEIVWAGSLFSTAYYRQLKTTAPRYYVRTLGSGSTSMKLIVLSTCEPSHSGHIGYYGETSSSNSTQGKWLVTTLKAIRTASPSAWIVVATHHPIADPEVGDPLYASAERKALMTLFVNYGVDVAACGDTHYYRRHKQTTGPTYIVQGTGGAPSVSVTKAPLDVYDVAKASGVFGYTMFTLDSTGLKGVTYGASPTDWVFKVIDTFTVSNRKAVLAQ